MRRSLFVALTLATSIGLASLAHAEDEEQLDDVSAQVKAQMEKIIKLMRENEQALIEISAGGKAKPKRVDVDIPVPPSSESPSGQGSSDGAEGGGSSSEGPRDSEEILREMKELLEGQRTTGAKIPGELEELVRMVPQ